MTTTLRSIWIGVFLVLCACGGGTNVSNVENARRAYLGMDRSIDKAIDLAMQGYNMATAANIPDVQTTGDVSGTLGVAGQVSRGTGASANSEMRLSTTYTMYSDAVTFEDGGMLRIRYDGAQLTTRDLNLSLRGIPTGTFTGTLARTLTMSGDLTGDVTLQLAFVGQLQATTSGGIQRAPGTTHITGTAMSPFGTFNVDVMR